MPDINDYHAFTSTGGGGGSGEGGGGGSGEGGGGGIGCSTWLIIGIVIFLYILGKT